MGSSTHASKEQKEFSAQHHVIFECDDHKHQNGRLWMSHEERKDPWRKSKKMIKYFIDLTFKRVGWGYRIKMGGKKPNTQLI